jgi:exodeoxyribonuclease VII small subunit
MASKQTFEKAMTQLEKIVQELESEELSLEKAISKFEEGMKLSQLCKKTLDASEKKINLLLKQTDGSIIEAPFESDDAASGS